MGSIAAVFSRTGPPQENVVRDMLRAAPHRGTGVNVLVRGRAAVGISNGDTLADASIASAGELTAVFAGTLDNQPQLLSRFRLDEGEISPARVVLEAFRVDGEAAPAALRGVFAGVVTDGVRLWLFRDQFAFGQIFFHDAPGAFYAATEPKQVIAGAGIAREPDLAFVERLYWGQIESGDVDEELGWSLKGIRRLPRATIARVEEGGVRRRRYWNPEHLIETARYSPDELQARFDDVMTQAVARTLTGADAVSLSGGVDSPVLAAFAVASNPYPAPIGAISSVYPDHPGVDESHYIKMIAEYLKMPLHTYVPAAGPLDDIEEWTRLCDGPALPVTPSQMAEVYGKAKDLGYRMILSGEQAEPIIDNYHDAFPYLLRRGRLRAFSSQFRERWQGGASRTWLLRQFATAFAPRWVVAKYEKYRPLSPDFIPSDWLDTRMKREAISHRDHLSVRRRWPRFQVVLALGPPIGYEGDEICQAVSGMRVRRPWVDVDVLEFFASLRAEVKYPRWEQKPFVRDLMRGKLPDEVVARRDKTRFDPHFMSRIPYPAFRKWLVNPKYRIRGVRYDVLAERLEREDLRIADYKWTLDLVKMHVFLDQW